MRRPGSLASAAVAAAAVVLALACPAARAGSWTAVSCTQPNGQPAPIDGWSAQVYSGQPVSGDADTCASGGALSAISSANTFPEPQNSGPEWVFAAPAGSTIVGGSLTATLQAPDGVAWLATPGAAFTGANTIASCVYNQPCGQTGLSGTFPITHPGGTMLFAPALCLNFAQPDGCPGQAGDAVNAEVDIHAADITLANSAEPGGDGFSGPLLAGHAHGVADLLFTATDPGGPGVYRATVLIDGAAVYSATPDANGGWCVPVGTDPSDGTLMFDHLQPCRALETVDVAIDTAALEDGSHDLRVIVSDAAGNAATVLDTAISTANPTVTPLPRRPGEVQARLTLSWHWLGTRTTLRWVRARGLPRRAHVSVRCLGRGCPRLARRSPAARVGRLWRSLSGRRFRAGDRLLITITAPRRSPERIELVMRTGALPRARLL